MPRRSSGTVGGSVMRREELEPSRVRYTSEHATLELWAPPSCRVPVVIVRVDGHAREEIVSPILSTLEEAMHRGPVAVFDDWEGVTGYDPVVRIRMTDWTRQHGGGISATHILLASKLLSMGVSLATRAAGLPVTVHDGRFEFERVLRAHFPQYRSAAKRIA